MRKTINNVKVEGKVYDHSLKAGVSKTGKNYVMGELQIQVSDTNTVPVRFIEMETSSSGNENKKYKTLVNLMNTVVTVSNAKEGQEPTCVSIGASTLAPEEFTTDGVVKTNFRKAIQSGGFVNVIQPNQMNPQATFKNDVMITGTVREIDPVTTLEKDYLTVNAYVFDYKNSITPMTFQIYNPNGINYFQSLAPNTFTQIWGKIESNTIKTVVETQNAFGEPLVEETTRTTKQWVITGANQVPFGEDQMTVEEWNNCLANRNMYTAELAKKEQEFKVNKNQGGINTAPQGGNPFGGLAGATSTGAFAF